MSEIIDLGCTGDLSQVRTLRCSECGGRLQLDYVEGQVAGTVYVKCLDCKQMAGSRRLNSAPPWVAECGKKVATTGIQEPVSGVKLNAGLTPP